MQMWKRLLAIIAVWIVAGTGFVWSLSVILNRAGYGDLLVPIIVLIFCLSALLTTKINYKWNID